MANTQINIDANGTKTLATAGKYCDRNVDVNVNVPIPSGYIKPSGTKSITTNGTHDVTSYASASVNIPASGITPSGTKTITSNGTYDVTSYASAQVNVPASGITPSGSINITANGTHDVTNYASAVVNVPTPEQMTVVRTITLSSDITNTPWTATAIISGDSFVKKHYADTGFSVTIIPTTQIGGANKPVSYIYHGNRNIGLSDAARYGIVYVGSAASSIAMLVCTAKVNGEGYNVSVRVDSSGNVKVHCPATYKFAAGTYNVILTCIT